MWVTTVLLFATSAGAAAQQPSAAEALWAAAIAGDAQRAGVLLGRGIEPDVRDGHGETALMKAAGLQARADYGEKKSFVPDRKAVAEALLAKGADPNAKDEKGRTPLLFAAQGSASEYRIFGSNEPMIRLLLSRGARIDDRDNEGWTPLLTVLSQWADQPNLVRFLLDSGANVRAKTKAGKTALTIAAMQGKEDMVALVLSKGVDVNARDIDGVTPLMVAASGRLDVHASIVKTLLAHGADVNAKDNEGRTAIEKAMEAGYLDRVAMLKAHGSDVDIMPLNRARNQALLLAAEREDIERAKALLQDGADVNYKNAQGTTSLMIACQKDHGGPLISLLIGLGADVHAVDASRGTALHYAADAYDAAKLKPLLEKGADPNSRDGEGNTALIRAAASRRSYIEERTPTMHLLIDKGADPKMANAKGVTGLMLASAEGNSGLLSMIEKGVDVNASDVNGDTALHYAARFFVRSNPQKAGMALIENGADVNAANKLGITPLMLASAQYETYGVELLLEKGAKVNARAQDGRTALLFAIDGPKEFDNLNRVVYSPAIARLLIAAGADVNAQDSEGRTPLHKAVVRGHSDIIPFLLEHGAGVNIRDKNGKTPLSLSGHLQINILLKKGGATE